MPGYSSYGEMILSGGGARNATLVAMLAEALAPLGIQLRFSDEFGLPSEAKEAVAFAVLAYETWNRRPSNVPSATGQNDPRAGKDFLCVGATWLQTSASDLSGQVRARSESILA